MLRNECEITGGLVQEVRSMSSLRVCVLKFEYLGNLFSRWDLSNL